MWITANPIYQFFKKLARHPGTYRLTAEEWDAMFDEMVAKQMPHLTPKQRIPKKQEYKQRLVDGAKNALTLIYAETHKMLDDLKQHLSETYGIALPEKTNLKEIFDRGLMSHVISYIKYAIKNMAVPMSEDTGHKLESDISMMETDLAKRIEPELINALAILPDAADIIKDMIYYDVAVPDPSTGTMTHTMKPSASLSRMVQYLTNIVSLWPDIAPVEETGLYTVTLPYIEEMAKPGDPYGVPLKRPFNSSQEAFAWIEGLPEDIQDRIILDLPMIKVTMPYVPEFATEGYVIEETGEEVKGDTPGQPLVKTFYDKESAEEWVSQFPEELQDEAIYEEIKKEEPAVDIKKTPMFAPPAPGSVTKRTGPEQKIVSETPWDYPTEFAGWDRIRNEITDLLSQRAYKEVLNTMGQETVDKIWAFLSEGTGLDAAIKSEVAEKLPEVKEMIDSMETKKTSAELYTHKKKAAYDIVIGDEILDSKYGKGQVTSVDNLDDGAVEVTFGPNVKIAHYPAESICAPCYVDSNIVEFKCPMDLAVINASACLGDDIQNPCSFLRFVEDKPHCTYMEEMKKSKEKADTAKRESIHKEINRVIDSTKIKNELQNILKDAKFTDHKAWFTVKEYLPVRIYAKVNKIGSDILGEVMERNQDSSMMVKWANGETTVNWEAELMRVAISDELQDVTKAWQTFPDDVLTEVWRVMMLNNMPTHQVGKDRPTFEEVEAELKTRGVNLVEALTPKR